MTEILFLSKLSHKDILEAEFGNIISDDIIVTNERIAHIKNRHSGDYELFVKYRESTLSSPDIIIKDSKNEATVFMIKKMSDTNVNVVVKIALESDNVCLSNSVITSYRIRQKNLEKLIKKNKTLYKSE